MSNSKKANSWSGTERDVGGNLRMLGFVRTKRDENGPLEKGDRHRDAVFSDRLARNEHGASPLFQPQTRVLQLTLSLWVNMLICVRSGPPR